MTVYRRPDPIPLHRARPTVGSSLGHVRAEQEDLHHLVARRIFLAITAGTYPEGSILPTEQVLSEELGVSRTALREAIKGLASKGMLETRRRRGTMVLDRARWNMLDADVIGWLRRDNSRAVSEQLWETVTALLPTLAQLAASRGASLLGSSRLASGAADLEAKAEFLVAVAMAAGNRFALSIVTGAVQNLLVGDRQFLERATGGLTPQLARDLAQFAGSGDHSRLKRALEAALQVERETAAV